MVYFALTLSLVNSETYCRLFYFTLFSQLSYSLDYAMDDEILTLKEVAECLKLAEKTAYRLAANGKLPDFKVGGSWRFKREDIENWIESQKTNGNQSKQEG